jgi:uncharacterized protein
MSRHPAFRQTALFLAITYLLDIFLVLALPDAHINVLFAALIPTMTVGILTLTATARGSRRAMWRDLGLGRAGRTGRSPWLMVLGVPALLLGLAYGVAVLLGFADLQFNDLGEMGSPAGLFDELIFGAFILMGEEIGWRGYLLLRVQQLTDRRRAAVVTGFFHGLSHLPLVLLASTYDAEGNRWYVGPSVVLVVTGAGVFYAYLRDVTGSLWPVTIAHSVANTMFDLGAAATVATGGVSMAYIAGESGLLTLASVGTVAAYLIFRGRVWRADGVPLDVTRATWQRPTTLNDTCYRSHS